MKKKFGFTLAELLIALTILGVIATFTIPKILQGQQLGRSRAVAKEAASTISQSFDAYKLKNTPDANTAPPDLMQYMNYVRSTTSGTLDALEGQTTISCTSANPCMFLHNGAALRSGNANNRFGGTTFQNYIYFYLDPDGVDNGTTTGSGKSIILLLYYNGRISDSSVRPATDTTYNGAAPQNWGPDPASTWFSWN